MKLTGAVGRGRVSPSIGIRPDLWLFFSPACPRRGTGHCRRRGRLGSWTPAFGGAGLGRLGEWRPPGPSCFRFCFRLFFCFLCTDEGLSGRVAERSSAVRGCRAALSHMVLYVCCLLRVFFLFRPGCLSFLSRFYRSVIDTD